VDNATASNWFSATVRGGSFANAGSDVGTPGVAAPHP
jgi:hypothetical protein